MTGEASKPLPIPIPPPPLPHFDITISKSAVGPLVRAMDSVLSGTPIPNATWAEKEAMLQLKETLLSEEKKINSD